MHVISFNGSNGTKRLIELILFKLNLYQSKMNELSREELLEIMSSNDLDLSWIASQESVDALAKKVENIQNDVNRIGEHIMEDWYPPYTSPELSMFVYSTNESKKIISLSGFSSMYDHLTDNDIITIPKTMTINDVEYTVEIGSDTKHPEAEFTNIHMKQFIADGIDFYALPMFKGTYVRDTQTNVRNDNLELVSLTNIGKSDLNLGMVTAADFSNASMMFAYLTSIKTINISTDATIAPTNCSMMFMNDSSITSINLSAIDFRQCDNGVNMFKGCTNLTEILVKRNRWVPDTCIITGMFDGCGTDHITYVD